MKRTKVFKYEIFGTACAWPVVVDLSRDEGEALGRSTLGTSTLNLVTHRRSR